MRVSSTKWFPPSLPTKTSNQSISKTEMEHPCTKQEKLPLLERLMNPYTLISCTKHPQSSNLASPLALLHLFPFLSYFSNLPSTEYASFWPIYIYSFILLWFPSFTIDPFSFISHRWGIVSRSLLQATSPRSAMLCLLKPPSSFLLRCPLGLQVPSFLLHYGHHVLAADYLV